MARRESSKKRAMRKRIKGEWERPVNLCSLLIALRTKRKISSIRIILVENAIFPHSHKHLYTRPSVVVAKFSSCKWCLDASGIVFCIVAYLAMPNTKYIYYKTALFRLGWMEKWRKGILTECYPKRTVIIFLSFCVNACFILPYV